MSEEKKVKIVPWPERIIQKDTQIEKLVRMVDPKYVPAGGISFASLPFQEIKWWASFINSYNDKNRRKVFQRACVFVCFLDSKKLKFEKESITNTLLLDFFEFLKESKIVVLRQSFEWHYAISEVLLAFLNMNVKAIEGWEKVNSKMKKFKAFAGEAASVDPYRAVYYKNVWISHPEDGNALVEKMLTLCRIISPCRNTFFDAQTFENMTYDPEKKVITFFKSDTKSGKGYCTITHYAKNPRFSLFNLFEKYIGMIDVKYRKGGFWRWHTPSRFAGNAGYFSPDRRFKYDDFDVVRKKMEALYLDAHPADIFFEELTDSKLDRSCRFNQLNTNHGLSRFGVKSARKLYASSNSTNPNLTDEQASRQYWKSVQVYRDSYMKGQAEMESWRQTRVIDHMFSLCEGNDNFERMGNRLLKVLVLQNQIMLHSLLNVGNTNDFAGLRPSLGVGSKRSRPVPELPEINHIQPPFKKRKVFDEEQFSGPPNLEEFINNGIEKTAQDQDVFSESQIVEVEKNADEIREHIGLTRSLQDQIVEEEEEEEDIDLENLEDLNDLLF